MLKRFLGMMHGIRMAVQKTLMAVSLMILYVIGFGLTSLFVRVLRRDLLPGKARVDRACWREASGHDADADEMLHQA